MPTINGNRTVREVGQLITEHLSAAGFSEPYPSISPQWYWKLNYELEFMSLVQGAEDLIVVVTPDMEGVLTAPQSDQCGENFRYGMLVILVKKLTVLREHDQGGDDEISELATLSQEVGESLRELGPASLVSSPFIDAGLLAETRSFASSWSVELA